MLERSYPWARNTSPAVRRIASRVASGPKGAVDASVSPLGMVDTVRRPRCESPRLYQFDCGGSRHRGVNWPRARTAGARKRFNRDVRRAVPPRWRCDIGIVEHQRHKDIRVVRRPMKGQRRAERELTLSASSMHLVHAAHQNNARDSQAGVVAQIGIVRNCASRDVHARRR